MRLAPRRRRGVELLDDPNVDAAVRARSLSDVARSNQWLGGRRAARLALDAVLADLPRDRTLVILDVGTGAGDLAALARERVRRAGGRATIVAVDLAESLALAARATADHAIAGDACALPFAAASVDLALCSQLLHHFETPEALCLLGELHRVTRGAVVVADLRRSWLAAIGFWLVSWPLGFHRITRHDGVVSVLRGFTSRELQALVRDATGVQPRVSRRLGWRLVATWRRADATTS